MTDTNQEPDTGKPMEAIFLALQELLEAAAPSLRHDYPQKFADIMQMVASGRASFSAKISTSPAMVTLTITSTEGEHELVSFMYSGTAN